MPARPKYKDGQYLIECAICGCIKYSSEIILAKESQLPVCYYHAEENHTIPRINVPHTSPPNPTGESEDTFITYDTPEE